MLVDVSMALWAVLALLGCLALFWMQRSRQLGTDARALPVLLGAWLASMVFVYVVVARWYLPSDAGRYALLVVPFAALLQAAAV